MRAADELWASPPALPERHAPPVNEGQQRPPSWAVATGHVPWHRASMPGSGLSTATQPVSDFSQAAGKNASQGLLQDSWGDRLGQPTVRGDEGGGVGTPAWNHVLR